MPECLNARSWGFKKNTRYLEIGARTHKTWQNCKPSFSMETWANKWYAFTYHATALPPISKDPFYYEPIFITFLSIFHISRFPSRWPGAWCDQLVDKEQLLHLNLSKTEVIKFFEESSHCSFLWLKDTLISLMNWDSVIYILSRLEFSHVSLEFLLFSVKIFFKNLEHNRKYFLKKKKGKGGEVFSLCKSHKVMANKQLM